MDMHAYSTQQIREDFATWSKTQKKQGIRFGQYFCNQHDDMRSDSKLWNMADAKEALNYLLQRAQF